MAKPSPFDAKEVLLLSLKVDGTAIGLDIKVGGIITSDKLGLDVQLAGILINGRFTGFTTETISLRSKRVLCDAILVLRGLAARTGAV